MKILYATQASSAEMFHAISSYYEKAHKMPKGAFIVSDKNWFRKYSKNAPNITQYALLSEWSIAEKAKRTKLDVGKVRKYEVKYQTSLWRAALCDRRLITGKASSYKQDYKPRLAEKEILLRLQVACEEMESFFDNQRPEALVGFLCVTYIEYIAYLIAKSRNIPIYNFRPVRINNQVFIDSCIYDPPQDLIDKYSSSERPTEEAEKLARCFMQQLTNKVMLYEGAVPLSKKQKPSRIGNLKKVLVDTLSHQSESHSTNPLPALLSRLLILPFFKLRKKIWGMTHPYLQKQDLTKINYAFYAMHLEPELALLLFAPAYLNQIEIIRSIAYGLPAGMKLVVKDHPVGLHRRTTKYLSKILEIPNVVLANPYIHTKELIEHSQMVVAIGGSVGIEALVRKKPVLTLGPCAVFSVMQKSTLSQKVEDLNFIDRDIRQLLEKYKYNEDELVRFLAFQIEISSPINIYSTLLKRQDGFKLENVEYDQEVAKTAELLLAKMQSSKVVGTIQLKKVRELL